MSSNKNLAKVEETLRERKIELEQELALLYADGDNEPQGLDAADLASTAIYENLKSSLQSTELEEYKKIIKALEMIKSGTYGKCTDCAEPIQERRLKSYPNAARCLVCQEIAEESQSGSNTMNFL